MLAIAVLANGRSYLQAAQQPAASSVEAPASARVVLLATNTSADASDAVVQAAIDLAVRRHARVHVLHVQEADVINDDAVDLESPAQAEATLASHLDRLRAAGVNGRGEVSTSTGAHADVATVVLARAAALRARPLWSGGLSTPGPRLRWAAASPPRSNGAHHATSWRSPPA